MTFDPVSYMMGQKAAGGGGSVTPSFQGITSCYVGSRGDEFCIDTEKTQYLNVFQVLANHKYALFVGETISNRRRAGFWGGKTYSDFEPYLNGTSTSQQLIYANGEWLAPFVAGINDTGNSLAGRIIFTPSTDGVIVFATSNNGTTAKAYCVDIT